MKTSPIAIDLIDSMGGDLSIVNSARVSFDKWHDEIDPERDPKLIRYLADHRHMTPFRHNCITLQCKAPIFLARQLGKHQVGLSWNEVSRRYVSDEPEFYAPDEWRSKPNGSIKQGSGEPVHTLNDGSGLFISDAYSEMLECALTSYNTLLESDVAPEMARMVLPQSMMTTWIWSGSLLAFAHIYNERAASGAQAEAREFARLLDDVIAPLFPHGWEALKRSASDDD